MQAGDVAAKSGGEQAEDVAEVGGEEAGKSGGERSHEHDASALMNDNAVGGPFGVQTMQEFLDKFAEEEGALLDVEKFWKKRTSVRIARGKFRGGVLTTADWDTLAKKAPHCEELELVDCGLSKIETPSATNPLSKTLVSVAIRENAGLSSLEFVIGLSSLVLLAVQKAPLLKTKADIDCVFRSTLRAIDIDWDPIADNRKETFSLFGLQSVEDFRAYCFGKAARLELVNGCDRDGVEVDLEEEESD